MLSLLRPNRHVAWLAFFGLVLIGWGLLFLMAAERAEGDLSRIYGAEFWNTLCATDIGDAGFAALWSMWALMAAAMMAPTLVPALRTFDDLSHTGAVAKFGFLALLAGYLGVWFGFAAAAAGAQMALAQAGLLAPDGSSLSLWLTSGLLALAGLYQFSVLKEACLSKCRAPLSFFMQHWRSGRAGAAVMGLRLGVVCLGCCWALMLLGFVGGTMNLVWMGLATILMVIEKLPDLGRLITRPLGWTLLAGACWTAVLATGLI